MNTIKSFNQENYDDKVINWDDFKVWLQLKLPELKSNTVVNTIEPVYNRLIEKIKAGKIVAYTITGKMPKLNGLEYILTPDNLDLFMQGTFLKAQDIIDTFDELDADEKGEIIKRFIENRRIDDE